MRIKSKPRIAWTEGIVNRRRDHASLSYGEDRRVVALVGRRPSKGFTVQFMLKARQADQRAARILDAVRKDLTFYLLDVVGPDSWPFVEYHCSTPANTRSIVRWNWHSKSSAS